MRIMLIIFASCVFHVLAVLSFFTGHGELHSLFHSCVILCENAMVYLSAPLHMDTWMFPASCSHMHTTLQSVMEFFCHFTSCLFKYSCKKEISGVKSLSKKVNEFLILIGFADKLPKGLYHFAFLPAMHESA